MRVTPLALAAALSVSCVSAGPVVDPPPVAAAPSAELTRLAIQRACLRVGFTVDEEAPGLTRASIHRNEWRIAVDVRYDESHVQVHYADSLNMGYHVGSNGTPQIRSSYNAWAQKLAAAIEHDDRLITADENPDALLGPPIVDPGPPAAKSAR